MQSRSLTTALLILTTALVYAQENLLPDPSIEEFHEKNQFGVPYVRWGGWIFEGRPEFRVAKIARTGQTCAEIVGAVGGKIRLYTPPITVAPGRYRFSCYIRGLDIGLHPWGLSLDVNFADDKYMPLKKTGTFGWTKLSVVRAVPEKREIQARIGLWAPGRLWIDDAEIVRVPDDTPLTEEPILGPEETPILPPAPLDPAQAIRCPDCGYRNMPVWGRCYVCGATLQVAASTTDNLPPTRLLASFEDGTEKPFSPAAAAVVAEHATHGRFSLRLDRNWISWDGLQDWTGYDFLKADVFNPAEEPRRLYVEIRDRGTTGYWTRVNYDTVAPPGSSVLIVPTDIYVGEKSRPGRPLDKAHVTRLVLSVGVNGPLYFDNLRIERDLSDSVKVPGLLAFDFGPGTYPPFRGFIAVTPVTQYSPGRGFGFVNARIWRAFDVLQPDPLYQTFICIEAGGFRIDLPNGHYHVFMNLDSPSGYWGEYQVYRERLVKANGVAVVHDRMDLNAFLQRYFRFADVDDSPEENTFDKYQRAYFQEKEFDVTVTEGYLLLEFSGANWANSLSALVVYPVSEAEAGRRYLENLRERRRFFFDNYFKRVLPNPHKDALGPIPDFEPTPKEQQAGYVLFARDWMADVNVNSLPRREEITNRLEIFASAGELEPIVFSLYPLRDLGPVTISATALQGPDGASIPADAIRPGIVSHRLSRVTMEGTVYTIAPRFVMPRATTILKKGVTTTFWLTLHTPKPVRAGLYRGRLRLDFANGQRDSIELRARLFATPLEELDIPAGPWGCTIHIPWPAEELGDYEARMFRLSLAKMREYGCTSFSGIPTIRLRGWHNRQPDIDFSQADAEMAAAKAAGFRMLVVNYGRGIIGFDNYRIDTGAMQRAGFDNYVAFLRAILTPIQEHARAAGWLPVAFNLCDEPIGDDIAVAAANARAWREAAPPELLTTGATSLQSPAPDDPHLPLVQALKIANLNLHDEAAITVIRQAGNDWAFYNGGNRWTFGVYMFKAARAGMKFRLSWHWNASAGDPYYALDCREDDYSWCHTNGRGELIPSLHFERDIREGIDDYRYMLTLSRLLEKKPSHPAAPAARALLENKLKAFRLGERNHEAKWPLSEYRTYRLQLAEAIERLSR